MSELEARIRELEKQRGEVIAAFRKQIKLIDILKRQKVRLFPLHSILYNTSII